MVVSNQTKQRLQEAIIGGKHTLVPAIVEEALKEGASSEEILNQVMIPAMDVVGDRYSKGEIYIPEMMIAARAMGAGLDLLRPRLLAEGAEAKGKAVIGTVKGDLHDIGKNIVSIILQGAGYEMIDLGVDVAPERFADAAREHSPNFVLLSALLTTTMENMAKTISVLKEQGLRDDVKIGVGGAPLTEAFAREIGADFYGADAREAVLRCNELI